MPANKIIHGFSGPENDEGPDRLFAWDNERSPYNVDVPAFEAQARPICNGEYAAYLLQTGNDIAVTWTMKPLCTQTEVFDYAAKLNSFCERACIKTVYGPISLKMTTDWPVIASYNELSGYATESGLLHS